MTRTVGLTATIGAPSTIGLPPEPRPVAIPAPTPTPAPTPDPSATRRSVGHADADRAAIRSRAAARRARCPAISVPVEISRRVRPVRRRSTCERDHDPRAGRGRVAGSLDARAAVPRARAGRRRSASTESSVRAGGSSAPDGVVWAENRDDGARVYPQEALAGQVDRLRQRGDRRGSRDAGGRGAIGPATSSVAAGLESGAEDAAARHARLVARGGARRGRPRRSCSRPRWFPARTSRSRFDRPSSRRAGRARRRIRQGATAVVDPRSGDVWALASQPAFNPNSMTIGSTLGGVPLSRRPAPARSSTRRCWRAYPAGSSFKPFTLVAALKTGVVTPASTRHLPADLAVRRLHVPQLHEPHAARAGRAGRVDGLQLQHDLHAAGVRGLPGRARPRSPTCSRTSASARRPASAT